MLDDMLNNPTISLLAKQFAEGKNTHAYIVEGDSALLSRALNTLAQLAVCDKGGCGDCNNCRNAIKKTHPDVLYYPMDDRKTMTVDDIKDIIARSVTSPSMSARRVFVINASVNSTMVNWQGKLLKILEEPPLNHVFFIGVNNSGELLDTIKSRCGYVKLDKMSFAQVKDYLIKCGYNEYSSEITALVSQGNISNARGMLLDDSTEKIYKIVSDMLCNMTNTRNSLKYVSQLAPYKDKYSLVLGTMSALMGQALEQTNGMSLLKEQKNVIIAIAYNYSYQALLRCIELIDDAYQKMVAKGNYNVIIDSLVLKILEVRYRCQK